MFELTIGLTLNRTRPHFGESSVKRVHGGPRVLLGWLENQLALNVPETSSTERVIQYMQMLEPTPGDSFRDSFEVDRWATSRELLNRRDELMLCGWDGVPDQDLPALVNDLAAVETQGELIPGVPDRLRRVQEALDDGQNLPPHRGYLYESINRWPRAWRGILGELNLESASDSEPQAPEYSTLRAIQQRLSGVEPDQALQPDETFGHLAVHSRQRACVAVSAMLAKRDNQLDRTAVVCRDTDTQSLLERTLREFGFPNTGVARLRDTQPVLQILPLQLELLWEPVDPQTVMDFLALPLTPIPSFVSGRLQKALSEQPGLGSARWESARERCLERSRDRQRIQDKFNDWLEFARQPVGEPVPVTWIEQRCNRIASWARGFAEQMVDGDEHLEGSLKDLATMASAFKEIALQQGPDLSKPQLDRILEDVRDMVSGRAEIEPAGPGPLVIQSPADLPAGIEDVIWLGLSADKQSLSGWTHAQRERLLTAEIDIDHLEGRRVALRDQERRGLVSISGSLTAIELTPDDEQPAHPLWIRIDNILSDDESAETRIFLNDYLDDGEGPFPYGLDARFVEYDPPQPQRPEWDLPEALLTESDSTSATEMKERLGCPARWVFNRAARLRPSSAASIPGDFQLKGSFSHQIFETVFDGREEVPEPEAAARMVSELFHERVDKDAAPLSLPAKLAERQNLHDELVRAARRFVEILRRGEYRVKGMEVPLDGELHGKKLRGSIDCVLGREGGNEAVVDLKYRGRNKFPAMLEEGRAVQLAVYCEARRQTLDPPARIEGTGYFVFGESLLYTPVSRPVQGTDPEERLAEAEDIFATWERFDRALQNGDQWLTGEEPVPARPLQNPELWPEGADMVIDTSSRKSRDELEPCRYCDYDVLCGLRTCD